MRHGVYRWILSCVVCALCTLGTLPRCAADSKKSARDVANLFSEEIQQVVVKLKWRGERLTDDTLYAAALTGLSWETAWGKDHLFSLAWGDLKKLTKGRRKENREALIENVQRLTEERQYQRAIDLAASNFTLEEIGKSLHLTRERARQIELQALEKLRGNRAGQALRETLHAA